MFDMEPDDNHDTKNATSHEELKPSERAKLLHKLDWHLLPQVTLLFLLSFLDRSNIGNARIAGMSTDLHLIGLRYNTAAAVFYVLYIVVGVPSNILLKRFRPSRWFPIIIVAWGLIATLMCLVKTYRGLLIARLFLGLTEGGLFPGVNYYLAVWYPREDRARRIAIFYSAATISGAFGGILAYIIEKMDGLGGLHGWQWIFCLEGLATIIVAFGAFFLIPDYPETASFLTDTERCMIVALMKKDSQDLAVHYDFQFVLQALKDYNAYILSVIYIGLIIPVYTIALFMPTIINELGFSAADAQLLTVPPFVAGCVCTILTAMHSDKQRLRGPYVIAGALVSIVGYIILYIGISPRVAYAGAILAAAGVYPTIAVSLAWISSNAGGDMKRGVVIAMTVAMANLGGFPASFIYFDPPRFHVGHGTNIGCLSLSILMTVLAMWNYNRLNRQKEKQCQEGDITEDGKGDFRDMGDHSPLFRYTL